MKDYAEILCQAVDEIVSKKIEGISFDVTSKVKIVDNSQAEKGKYQVTDSVSTFYAYSQDSKLKVGEIVYVTIPNGDSSQQKIIVGKYVAEDDKPFIFTLPFDTILDISGNIIEEICKDSLLANYDGVTEKLIWEQSNINQTGYTRLGIQAQFKTLLREYLCIKGNYGLKLEITTKAFPEDTLSLLKEVLNNQETDDNLKRNFIRDNIENEELKNSLLELATIELIKQKVEEEINKKNFYSLYLDSKDMYGDPFNFSSYYQQEKVFDISDLGTIEELKLYFYQDCGSFIDSKGNLIPYKDELDNLLLDNLFIKDPYICLGYNLSDYDKNQAILYTLDSEIYGTDYSSSKNKNVLLRWIKDGKVVISDRDINLNKKYDIRWYKFVLGAPSADEYSGVFWKRVNNEDSDYLFSYNFSPDVKKENERIKVIIIDGENIIYSNIVTFSNKNEVINQATVDYVAGLNIWCTDNTYGNYYIYQTNNRILENHSAKQARKIVAMFSPEETILQSEPSASILTEAEELSWTISTENTMIILNNIDYRAKDGEKTICAPADNANWSNAIYDEVTGTYTYTKGNEKIVYNDSDKKITIIKQGVSSEGFTIDSSLYYFVKDTYNQSYSNNIIQCKVRKNGIDYYASKELNFGQAGTVGSVGTLVIDFVPGSETALTVDENGKIKPLLIKAFLYDENNREIDVNDQTENKIFFEWSWQSFYSTEHLNSTPYNEKNPSIKISEIHGATPVVKNENVSEAPYNMLVNGTTYYNSPERNCIALQPDGNKTLNITNAVLVLKVVAKNFGNYNLVAYKGIPIRRESISIEEELYYPHCVDGVTEIIYDSYGAAGYYKSPWKIYCKKDEDTNSVADDMTDKVQWRSYNPYATTEKEKVYFGEFDNTTRIYKPLPFYIDNGNKYDIVQCLTKTGTIFWSQPIVTMQNKYPIATINEWDGKELKIDKSKGSILAVQIAAGEKHSDNTFSGVIMGDWKDDTSASNIKSYTGLFGFNHGVQTFGFKEDGSAFIGRSDGGRVEVSTEDFLSVDFKTKGGTSLLKIDDSTYYLQSANYISGASGTKIDLYNGSIDGYNFKLSATGSGGSIILNSGDSTSPFKIGDNFKVDWDGSVTATKGTIGGFTITDHSIYKKADNPKGSDIYLGLCSTNCQPYNKNLTAYPAFALGSKFLYDGSAANGKGKLFIASNLYRPSATAENETYFLIGINMHDNLQIGSADKTGRDYNSVNIYSGSGDESAIRLIPNGESAENYKFKVTETELRVKDILPENQHGIYARFG